MAKPVVALVGRPNVGKSTLFNRLTGERLAIVDEIPGTTRDRLLAEADWSGYFFYVMDTGGIDPTKAKGQTPLSIGSHDFISQIRDQAELAIQESDLILFIVDGQAGVTPADHEIADILRRSQKKVDGQFLPPIILVVNKAESAKIRQVVGEFYELGMGEPYAVSALHGTGTGDLLDEVVKHIEAIDEDMEEDMSAKIAIVGKPNVGKSSLLNKIVGQERAIVSEIPGTTRDAVDTKLIYNDLPVTLIDTAGIRRRGKVSPGVEKYSVVRSMKAIERADVAILVIDATTSITVQDTHIAGYIKDAWKSAVVTVNKWDLVEKDTYTINDYTDHIRQELNFMDYVPMIFISALTGKRVDQVLPLALQVQEERLVRLTTSQINKIIQRAQDMHPAPSKTGRALRIYYGTQVRSDPPTFMLYVNDPALAHFTYLRYLENQIRKDYPFVGTPVRLVLKKRRH
ncbi:MAG: ribosome biogenesis GTPase Der [Chloroflexota bacterium]|nr:ribosome biogenesis GTPase Der [Chloroflexota bacterium]